MHHIFLLGSPGAGECDTCDKKQESIEYLLLQVKKESLQGRL